MPALAEDRPHSTLTTLPREALRLPAAERSMLRALAEDGRRANEDLARLAGVSVATVRRRLDALRRESSLFVRTVVEPALLGLPSRPCPGSARARAPSTPSESACSPHRWCTTPRR
jgi:hypothetical protein